MILPGTMLMGRRTPLGARPHQETAAGRRTSGDRSARSRPAREVSAGTRIATGREAIAATRPDPGMRYSGLRRHSRGLGQSVARLGYEAVDQVGGRDELVDGAHPLAGRIALPG